MSHHDLDPEDEIRWSDDDDHLFDSPIASKPFKEPQVATNGKPVNGHTEAKSRLDESRYDAEEAREAALRQELENVRKINQVIEGVIESIETAKINMDTVSHTVNSASTLLQTWTRILSQTEHNQRLILNPSWNGATQDIADIESEEVQRQRDVQRRQIEEQQRREATTRKAEDEERRRAEASTRGQRGTRGRARGTGRAGSVSGATSSGYGTNRVGGGGTSMPGVSRTSGVSRGGSDIGRGSRSRGRG